MNKEYLSEKLPAFKIYTFSTVNSTNILAKTVTDDYALIIADSQTNGRGRLGRSFSSPKGAGIYMSVVFPVTDLYRNVPFITTAAAVALHKSIYETTGISTHIKWVNDIYKGDKKVSGILSESIDGAKAVVGIGLNLFPADLPPVATSLFEKPFPFSREDLIIAIINNLMYIIEKLPDTSFIDYYKAHSMVLGRSITCILPDRTFTAKAIDIDSSGFLVVETENGTQTLSTGEISIRLTD